MSKFRVESSCARTGEYQHTEVYDRKSEVHIHCTEPWRAQSVHVVYALQPGLPPRMIEVYTAGRKVSPVLM